MKGKKLRLLSKRLSFRRKPESSWPISLFWIPAFAGMTILMGFIGLPCVYGAGTTAGETLIQSVSARAQAMGEAYSSIPANEGGVLTYHYNPAALGFSNSMETEFTFRRGVADDNFAVLALGYPSRMGKFAGTLLYYSVGTIDLITTAGSVRSVKAQKDLVAVLTYSHLLWNNFSWGINGKFLRSELVESFTANAFAADVGAQYKIMNVVLGAAVQNTGTALKYNKTSDPLPLTFRSGLSYRKEWSNDYKGIAAFDLMKRQGENPKVGLGLEYSINGTVLPHQSELALRAGYRMGEENGKISFGLGFNIDHYRMDYAMQLMDNSGSSHLVTFGFVFGNSN